MTRICKSALTSALVSILCAHNSVLGQTPAAPARGQVPSRGQAPFQPLPAKRDLLVTIEGIVRDASGQVLPGVAVEITSGASIVFARGTTGIEGEFRLQFETSNFAEPYDLRIEQTGFSILNVRLKHDTPEVRVEGKPLSVVARLSYAGNWQYTKAGPQANHAKIPVFYATDRDRSNATTLNYGPARNQSERLYLGRFDVSVPRDHRMGSVERPDVWTLWREDPSKHFIIVRREQQTYESFYREVADLVEKSERKQALVFIHGYNVTFESAIYRTAQITYDLGFDGAPILYSWPSEGSETAYPVDLNNSDWTAQHLRWFLEDVSAKSGANVVHLIAHSMGNRPLVAALKEIAAVPRQRSQPLFNQVMLTAPDVDLGTFKQIAQSITTAAQRITLYASSNDWALKASKAYGGYQRAGDSQPDVVVQPGIDTIDVSGLDTGLLGHSYYGDNRSVLSDIFALVREGKPPSERFALRLTGKPPRQWWVFRP